MKYIFEGNYSIYMEVTFCDSKGDVRKGIDRIDVISDVVIDKVLSAYREYYIVLSWEICLIPKRSK
jgi:hypothetical protein